MATEFYVITINGKDILVMSEDGINIVTSKFIEDYVDNMIKEEFFEDENDPDILKIKKEFKNWARYYNNEITEFKNQNIKQLNQLKEALDPVKYNKINSLINECLKEGIEVEISIPKKKLNL